MTTNPVDARDEGSHDAGNERLWSESWYFDFFQADGSPGGWVRIGLCHNRGAAWYRAYVVRPGRPIPPRPRARRCGARWSERVADSG